MLYVNKEMLKSFAVQGILYMILINYTNSISFK